MSLYAQKHWDCPTCRCAEPFPPTPTEISTDDQHMLDLMEQDIEWIGDEGFYTMANRMQTVIDRMKQLLGVENETW